MGLWKQLVRTDGTIALNLMDVHAAGSPNLDPYVERFTIDAVDTHGLNLAGRMPWISPTKLGHIEWTSKRAVRPRNTLEHVLLFSPSAHPSWDATRLDPRPRAARPPSKQASDVRRAGKSLRPSGLDIREDAFGTARGIADNVFVAGGASGADRYSRACRAVGVPAHPARFPREVPRRIILLTTEPGDICYDPMAGSNTTGEVARALGRRWISSEPVLDFGESSKFRFSPDRPESLAVLQGSCP
jgi:site-specific DNA-methyltransferase (cytosine-N4-specific)